MRLVTEGSAEWPDDFFGLEIWFNEWPNEWQCKTTSQQAERLAGLLERVEYDGRDGDLDIWLRSDQKEAS